LTAVHWLGILLATLSAAVYLWLGIAGSARGFLVVGGVFVVGAVLAVTGVARRRVYLLGIPYTLLAAGLWVLWGMPMLALGAVAVSAQLGLVAVLADLHARDRPVGG
jgi:hypothetical protein